MRYRRFGRTDLEVSEVGFGTWTLASDWWGRVDEPQGMIHAALDAGINFIDTAPVYGEDGVGETLLADVLKRIATTSCSPPSAATTSMPPAAFPGSRSARTTGSPRRSVPSSKHRCVASAPTTSTSTNSTTRGSSPSSTTAVGELEKLRAEGKVRELGVALGPGDRLGRRRSRSDPQPSDRVHADRLQHARAGAGAHVRASPTSPMVGRPHLARAARVGHAVRQGHA